MSSNGEFSTSAPKRVPLTPTSGFRFRPAGRDLYPFISELGYTLNKHSLYIHIYIYEYIYRYIYIYMCVCVCVYGLKT